SPGAGAAGPGDDNQRRSPRTWGWPASVNATDGVLGGRVMIAINCSVAAGRGAVVGAGLSARVGRVSVRAVRVSVAAAASSTGTANSVSDPARQGRGAAAGSGSSSSTIWVSLIGVSYTLRRDRVPSIALLARNLCACPFD